MATEAQKAKARRIIALLDQGLPTLVIAERLGVPRLTVQRIAQREGFELVRNGTDEPTWARRVSDSSGLA